MPGSPAHEPCWKRATVPTPSLAVITSLVGSPSGEVLGTGVSPTEEGTAEEGVRAGAVAPVHGAILEQPEHRGSVAESDGEGIADQGWLAGRSAERSLEFGMLHIDCTASRGEDAQVERDVAGERNIRHWKVFSI
jgi:hypothetical protein